jgi:hypothetical protein
VQSVEQNLLAAQCKAELLFSEVVLTVGIA